MADASRVKMAIAEETTFGVAETAGAGVYRYMRANTIDFGPDYRGLASPELDPDRQPAGDIRIGESANGNFVSAVSLVTPADPPAGFDMPIEGAFMGDFQAPISLTARSIDITGFSAGVFTLDDVGTNNAFANIEVGDWIELAGYDVNAGKIHCQCLSKVDAGTGSFQGIRETAAGLEVAVANEAGQTDISLKASRLRIGTTKKSYTVEVQYTDLTVPMYDLLVGNRVGSLKQSVGADSYLTWQFDFLGKLATSSDASSAGTPTAVWSTPKLASLPNHLKMKMINAFTSISLERVSRIEWELNNGLRLEPEAFVRGSADIGLSTARLSGTLTCFLTKRELRSLAEADTLSKLAYRMTDGTRSMIVSLDAIKFGSVRHPASGNDQSVLMTIPWVAEKSAATGYFGSLHRF